MLISSIDMPDGIDRHDYNNTFAVAQQQTNKSIVGIAALLFERI